MLPNHNVIMFRTWRVCFVFFVVTETAALTMIQPLLLLMQSNNNNNNNTNKTKMS